MRHCKTRYVDSAVAAHADHLLAANPPSNAAHYLTFADVFRPDGVSLVIAVRRIDSTWRLVVDSEARSGELRIHDYAPDTILQDYVLTVGTVEYCLSLLPSLI